MTWRRAALYWLCCVCLVGVDRLLVARRQAREATVTRAAFVAVPAGRINKLSVEQGAKRLRAERAGEQWRVIAPPATVPSDLVAALVDSLTTLPDVEVVAEQGGRLAEFGLAPPQATLTLGSDDDETHTVRFGSRNPAGTAVYAQLDDSPRVLLVGLNAAYYLDLLTAALP